MDREEGMKGKFLNALGLLLGIAAGVVAGGERSLIDSVLDASSMEQFRSSIMRGLSAVAEGVQARSGERTNRHINDILSFLENDCGPTVNLNTVASTLDLNPSYVSRLFRAECGVTFTK